MGKKSGFKTVERKNVCKKIGKSALVKINKQVL